MPLYEYICDNCQVKEEEIRLVEERNNTKLCSKCKIPMRKIINPTAAIIFPFKINAIGSSGQRVPGKFGG